MEKQKIVVRISMNGEKKTRKALKIAVSISGVESVSFIGADKDQIAVTGEGIDSVKLANLLRKKVGNAELVSLGPVNEKKPESKDPKPAQATVQFDPYQYYYNSYGVPYYYYDYVY